METELPQAPSQNIPDKNHQLTHQKEICPLHLRIDGHYVDWFILKFQCFQI